METNILESDDTLQQASLYSQIKGGFPTKLLNIHKQYDTRFSAIAYTYNTMIYLNSKVWEL